MIATVPVQEIRAAVEHARPDAAGEVRVNCPSCDGGQKDTLGVNVDTGAYHCFRCGLQGNYLKINGSSKKPLAAFLFEQARTMASHQYTEIKQIKPQEIRVDIHGNWVVPFRDQAGQLQTVQFIKPDSGKLFLSKAKNDGKGPTGAAYIINGSPDMSYVCEGAATGWSIHHATGATVYCVGGKENFKNVLPWVKTRHKAVVVAADNDKSGDGLAAAKKAAAENCLLLAYPGATGQDFNDMAIDAGLDAVKAVLGNPKEPGLGPEAPKFKLVKLSDIQIKPADWQTDGLMEMDSLNLLFSDPGGAKTFLAIDLACCGATGKDFHGRFVHQGPVVYIAGEGQNGLKRRFMAWGIRYGYDLDQAPVFLSLMPAGLCDQDQVGFVIEGIRAVADLAGAPVLIVLDTVARNFGPGDENSTKDMTGFIAGVDKIREKFRSCVLLVHHSGHADKSRGRGSMALKGALDTEYRLEKDEMGVIRVTNTKMKDHVPPEPMAFRLNTVELPFADDRGRQAVSAILDSIEYQPPVKRGPAKRVGKWQAVCHGILMDLAENHRRNLKKGGFDPDQAKVLISDVKEEAVLLGAPQKHWNRYFNYLSGLDGVVTNHPYFEVSPRLTPIDPNGE